MKTVTRRQIGLLCGVLASALVGGCLSPTLPPFPPPAAPQTMAYTSPGQLRLTGLVGYERSVVYALNSETGDIAGKLVTDGKYSLSVPAEPGQEIELYYQVGNDVSDSTFIKAPPYANPDAGASSTTTDSSEADGAADSGPAREAGAE